MLKLDSILVAIVTGALAMQSTAPQSSDALAQRVQELEQWKVNAEPRLQALEALFKAAGRPAIAGDASAAERVLTVVVSNKKFDPANIHSGKFEDSLWWDADYTATGLQKPARSIKGVLYFCDLFGDPRFQVRVTLDEPIAPKGTLKTRGVGIDFNQFLDDHKWLLSTELSNMTFKFQAETILYQDGTSERF